MLQNYADKKLNFNFELLGKLGANFPYLRKKI